MCQLSGGSTVLVTFVVLMPCLLVVSIMAAPGADGAAVCTLPTGSFSNFTCSLSATVMASLTSGGVYFNLHTQAYGGGRCGEGQGETAGGSCQ